MEVTKEYTYITNYNKGKIDKIKELAKELKQYSCYYDLANYISFEAITTSTVAEVVDSMIKKISRH